ncbi:hypothetical protein ACH5RR_024988 [Cinchona calisaya]|uniref:At1g61320/AtMIF1 LRR domain-containing protein n=1 Tax=Cinchona calisaya TaxID=153742 RepID=A0ABD2YYD3_9GENT
MKRGNNQKKAKTRVEDVATPDYFSQLPDSIIHDHIYSCLSDRDVARTSILSKNWYRIWATYSYVVFHFIHTKKDRKKEGGDEMFFDMVESSMCKRFKHKFYVDSIEMFIKFPNMESLAPRLDRWIRIAIERSINITEFDLRVESFMAPYKVPQVVLHAGCLKVLSLSRCKFDQSSSDIKLPQLQELSFLSCNFSGSLLFEKFLSGCPVIEYVKMSFITWKDNQLLIPNLPKLKCFECLYCSMVDFITISAANILSFTFQTSRDCWPIYIDCASCITSLKELKFYGNTLTDYTDKFEILISELLSLERLEFRGCRCRDRFRISSQSLKRLVFRNCEKLSVDEIDAPNLQYFEYNEIDQPFFPINASNELQIHFGFMSRGINSSQWLSEFEDLLLQLSCWKDFKLVVHYDDSQKRLATGQSKKCVPIKKNIIIHEKLGDVNYSCLNNFNSNNFILISSKNYSDLVDEIFFLSYPDTLSVMYSDAKSMELILEKLKGVGSNPHLTHKLIGYEVDNCKANNALLDPATNVFIQKHSNARYETSTVTFNWEYVN